jgi:hypothetical protein
MKRRKFLKFPIAAAALAALPGGAETTGLGQERAAKGFRVEAGKNRRQEELLIMGGSFDLKVSSRDTGGNLCIYDTTRRSKGGPAFHYHHSQDEWFYAILGEFMVRVGDDTFEVLMKQHLAIYRMFTEKVVDLGFTGDRTAWWKRTSAHSFRGFTFTSSASRQVLECIQRFTWSISTRPTLPG